MLFSQSSDRLPFYLGKGTRVCRAVRLTGWGLTVATLSARVGSGVLGSRALLGLNHRGPRAYMA